jgi:23S rRNA-/tRNA-specific pseudouridylate synthase
MEASAKHPHLSSLSNTLQWTVSSSSEEEGQEGRVDVTVRVRDDDEEMIQDEKAKKPSAAANNNNNIGTTTADDNDDTEPDHKKRKTTLLNENNNNEIEIPESVLQYERQRRKVQANQRSLTPLTIAEHLKIVYEDDDLIVTNKPSGILCVPGLYNKPNLLDLVCQHCELPKETASSHIVHRLDMDTSGLVLFAKTLTSLKTLQAAFRDRQVDKEYHALVCGHVPHEWKMGHIQLPLQRDHQHPPFMRIATPRSEVAAAQAVQDLQTHGFKKLVKKRPKPSHTEFRVLQREFLLHEYLPVTRVSLIPHTGRTHQLRVHCAALGYPIVGDPAYGLYGEANPRGGVDSHSHDNDNDDYDNEKEAFGVSLELQQQLTTDRPPHENPMCLHAAKLSLQHPSTGESMLWEAPTPF